MKPVVSEKFERLLQLARTPGQGAPSPPLVHVHRAVMLLHGDCAAEISRVSLARELGLNRDYLGKIFKRCTGMEIREYLNRLRVLKAAEYLAGCDERVIHISGMAGFENLRTFNRAFCRVMEMRPMEYRRMSRKREMRQVEMSANDETGKDVVCYKIRIPEP
ncbi:MAG: helix-turn-helix transcriptional regulator [Spirochaetes bacterium]|nr:helix-turn-helix transcriptional regulator [Spirochaetota bacterium]